MSIPRALEIGAVGALDLYTGLAVSSAVEVFAPPITNQSPVQLLIEGTVQFLTILFLSLEGTKLLSRTQSVAATPIPFAVGSFIGMPNTVAKLTMVAGYGRQLVKSIAFTDPSATVSPVPQNIPSMVPAPIVSSD